MNVPVLRLEGVRKTYGRGVGRVEVLRDIDLSIAEGEFVMVTGPSGSGKSTLLHLAALLERPDAGMITFLGEDMTAAGEAALCRARAEDLGVVFQRYALLPARSALANVAFRFRYTSHREDEAVTLARQALARVHLDDLAARPARVLSGGEMQRVAIARAIAARPRLLVADEPTGNLDGGAAREVMALFRELHRDGLTIVMVTHNLALLEYCSRHLELTDGSFEGGAGMVP